MTFPRTLMTLAGGALVALSACSDFGSSSSSSAAATTIESPPVDTVAVETVPGATSAPAATVEIEIGAADTSVVGGFDVDGAPASLVSRRFQITNNSPVALAGQLALNVGCADENVLSTTAPAPADELPGLDISPGEPVSVEVGASAQIFAVPVLVPDELPPCADGTLPALLLNVTDLLTGDPLPTITGPLMVVPGDAPQTFVVMEPVAEAING
jgi:hypothetical protein